jgi:hypothetical protein
MHARHLGTRRCKPTLHFSNDLCRSACSPSSSTRLHSTRLLTELSQPSQYDVLSLLLAQVPKTVPCRPEHMRGSLGGVFSFGHQAGVPVLLHQADAILLTSRRLLRS